MGSWRVGRGWSDGEIRHQLESLATAGRNFEDEPAQLDANPRWRKYSSEAIVGREEPGPPASGGPFEHGSAAVTSYRFSDASIVRAHFDGDAPLLHRRMLLEMRAVRVLHFLGGVIIGAVRAENTDGKSVHGFRYDTLEGHIERGSEWFLLTKDHDSGLIRFRISASWLPGDFPNWWSRLGFGIVGRHYQQKWHRRAHVLMARAVRSGRPDRPGPDATYDDYSEPDVVFERVKYNP